MVAGGWYCEKRELRDETRGSEVVLLRAAETELVGAKLSARSHARECRRYTERPRPRSPCARSNHRAARCLPVAGECRSHELHATALRRARRAFRRDGVVPRRDRPLRGDVVFGFAGYARIRSANGARRQCARSFATGPFARTATDHRRNRDRRCRSIAPYAINGQPAL